MASADNKGNKVLKNRFFLTAVDGEKIVVQNKSDDYATSVRCGRKLLQLAFVGYRDKGWDRVPVESHAEISVFLEHGIEYQVRGEIEGLEKVVFWIEEAKSSKVICEKVGAAVNRKRGVYDPLLGLP